MKKNIKILFSKEKFWQYVLLFLFFSLSNFSYSQIRVEGKVVDDNGESLIGVNVTVKDANQGTVTNADGMFSLEVPNKNVTLRFSYVGYETIEVPLNGQTFLNVTMKESPKTLEEIVVVGYGTQKKVSLTGSVSQISTKEITQAPSGDLSNALAGKLPGLVAVQRSGQPGADASSLLIRGLATLGDNSPMIIVDGVQREFNNLDPNEIESISILKDASAAAVYGVQGAGGVILVTTKRGKKQKPQITYTGKAGYDQNTAIPKYLNGPDFVKYYNKALEMDGLAPIFSQEFYNKLINGDPEGKIANTNWFKEFIHPGAWATHHNINVNGGSEAAQYFVSVGYLYKDGIIDKIAFERYNLRSNIDINLAKGLNLGLDLAARQEIRKDGYFSSDASQAWNNPFVLCARTLPIIPTEYEGLPTSSNMSSANCPNPIAYQKLTGYNNSVKNVLQTSLTLGWDIPGVKGLNIKVKAYYDKDYTTPEAWREPFKLNFFNPVTQQYSIVSANIGQPNTQVLRQGSGQTQRLTFQPSISYTGKFDKHDLSALLVCEASKFESQNISVIVQDFDITALHELNFGKNILNGNKKDGVSGASYVFPRAGYVGRINYGYDNKYLLELAARYDGSSRFPKDKRWGFFPAASVGWRVSEENFFKPYTNIVENLKLRASVGLLGNDRIGDFQYLNLMSPTSPAVYFGSSEYISLYTSGQVNRDITWEKTTTYNLGCDLSLKKEIFGMEFDWFYQITNDILISGGGLYPPSLGNNYPGTINGGKVSNKGFELVLSHQNRIDQFNYGIRGNVNWARNKILYMNESPNVPAYYRQTGNKMNRKKGFIAEGLFQSEEEILTSPTLDHISKTLIRPGDIKYKDLNGDGRINSAQDYSYIADSSTPELMFGLNLNSSWKNFDLTIFFQGAAMADFALSGIWPSGVTDNTQYTRAWYGNGNSPYFLIENSWTPEHRNAEFTRLTTQLSGNPNGWASTWWIRDASYLRLKNAQIGYTFKSKSLQKSGIENIRFTLTGGNLYTWSGLKKYGIDPESPDVTNGYYPQQRTYEFGLSITL